MVADAPSPQPYPHGDGDGHAHMDAHTDFHPHADGHDVRPDTDRYPDTYSYTFAFTIADPLAGSPQDNGAGTDDADAYLCRNDGHADSWRGSYDDDAIATYTGGIAHADPGHFTHGHPLSLKRP